MNGMDVEAAVFSPSTLKKLMLVSSPSAEVGSSEGGGTGGDCCPPAPFGAGDIAAHGCPAAPLAAGDIAAHGCRGVAVGVFWL